MPFSRRFHLSAPSVPIFIVSLIIAILAALVHYGHLAIFRGSYAFLALLIAYALLLLGVVLRRL